MRFPRILLLIGLTAMPFKLSDARDPDGANKTRDGSSLMRAMPIPRDVADPKDWEFSQAVSRFSHLLKLHVKFSVRFRGMRRLDRIYEVVEVESQTGEKGI